MRRREARVSGRREGAIIQLRTEVARMHVCDHQPLVFVRGQDLSRERIESIQVRPGYLDGAVHRLSDGQISQSNGNIVRGEAPGASK